MLLLVGLLLLFHGSVLPWNAAVAETDSLVAVGPSNSTIFCKSAVLNDSIAMSNAALDQPVDIDGQSDLDAYGDTFKGVELVVLQPGELTPAWTDHYGKTRGEALMWIPENVSTHSPRMLYIHGGGWVDGSPSTGSYGQFGARLAKTIQVPVLVIDYTLAPQGNFTSILKEVGTATHFLATHRPEDLLAGNITAVPLEDAPPLFIAGDSAGGGTALSALVAQASPQGLPGSQGALLSGGILFSPWIDLVSNTPTYYSQLLGTSNAGDVILGDIIFGFGGPPDSIAQLNQLNAQMYTPNLTDPIANPLYAPDEWLQNLAPVSLHAGMPEILQADTTLFATKAARAGASNVEAHLYDGMWHVFPLYTQGCGSGSPVVLAESSLKFSKQFVDSVVASMNPTTNQIVPAGATDISSKKSTKKSLCVIPHYEKPLGHDSAEGITC